MRLASATIPAVVPPRAPLRPTARSARPRSSPRRTPPPPHATPFELAWGTSLDGVDSQALASNLFAASLLPYLVFLYALARIPRAAGLTPLLNFGFRFLLVFVFASIPAGVYCKLVLHKILADVDVIHGGAESLLTLTNLMIVIGLRRSLREAEERKVEAGDGDA